MSIDIGAPLEEGIDRLTARNGRVFVGLVALLSIVSVVLAADLAAAVFEFVVEETDLTVEDIPTDANPLLGDDPTEPVVGVPPTAAVLGLLAVGVLNVVVTVGAARTFAGEERDGIPEGAFTRKLGWALLNLVVGGLVFGLAVGFGMVLVVPGIFLLVSLFVWIFPVVLDDETFVEGFRESWGLTRGNRVSLFVLLLVVFLLLVVASAVGNVVTAAAPPLAGVVVTALVGGISTTFGIAVAARTYRELQRAAAGPADSPAAEPV